MKNAFLPITYLGKWSVGLITAFLVFLILFFLILLLGGEKGGATFFSNLKLAIPMLLAGISGVASFISGVISIIKSKERSLSVILATLLGLFVSFWVVAYGLAFLFDWSY